MLFFSASEAFDCIFEGLRSVHVVARFIPISDCANTCIVSSQLDVCYFHT